MKFYRLLAGAAALAAVGVVVAPGVADAHQPFLQLTCAESNAHMFLYPADATYVLKVDGVNQSFAPNGTFHATLDPHVNHTASLHITPGSDGQGAFSSELAATDCVPTTTQAPTTTAGPTTTGAPTSTSSTPSTSTTTATSSPATTTAPSPTTVLPDTTPSSPSSEPSPTTTTGPSSTPDATDPSACLASSTNDSIFPANTETSGPCSTGSTASDGPTTTPSNSGTSDGSLPKTGPDLAGPIALIALIVVIIGLAFRGPQILAWIQRRRS